MDSRDESFTVSVLQQCHPEYQLNSSRHFMRELNGLGVTAVIDAGGGFQNYPDDDAIIERLHAEDQLTVRISYNLFTQKPKEELADFSGWVKQVGPGQGDDTYRHNGAGEMLVYSAADFEGFRVERPERPPNMEADLEPVIRLLAENRWPWRLHAAYDETLCRALAVFEKVNRDVPLQGVNWFLDHAETISERSTDRIAALGGGIAVQHRMMYQGEYFTERYGGKAAETTPLIRRMLEAGLPVGAGTDATRVASDNPWVSLSWGDLADPGRRPALSGREPAGPRDGAAVLDRGEHLVLERTGQEGPDQGGTACRPGAAVGGLLRGSGKRDCASPLGPDRAGRQGRAWRRRIRPAGAGAARADARLVAGGAVWRLLSQGGIAAGPDPLRRRLRMRAGLRGPWP